MGTEVIQFINQWLYDVDRFLRGRLEDLKDDLASDDPESQSKATEEVEQILDWLNAPPPPLSPSDRLQRALFVSQQDGLSSEAKEAAIALAMLSTGRRVGRPRETLNWPSGP